MVEVVRDDVGPAFTGLGELAGPNIWKTRANVSACVCRVDLIRAPASSGAGRGAFRGPVLRGGLLFCGREASRRRPPAPAARPPCVRAIEKHLQVTALQPGPPVSRTVGLRAERPPDADDAPGAPTAAGRRQGPANMLGLRTLALPQRAHAHEWGAAASAEQALAAEQAIEGRRVGGGAADHPASRRHPGEAGVLRCPATAAPAAAPSTGNDGTQKAALAARDAPHREATTARRRDCGRPALPKPSPRVAGGASSVERR